MPLIRYRIGDNGIAGGPCACGRAFPVLAKIWGRAYDVVEGLDGRRYHGEFFMYLFEDLRKSGYQIRQFQVIQDRRDHLTIRIVADSETVDRASAIIRDHLRDRLPGIGVTAVQCNAVERSASGKTQVVRNLLLAARRDSTA
jgi:phenylacetate-CoA ligase